MKKRYRFLPYFLILILSLLCFLPIPKVKAVFTYGNWNWDGTNKVLTIIANATNNEGNTEGNAYEFSDITNSGVVPSGYYNVSQSGIQFEFNFRIVIGDGTSANTTWFADISKQITFTEDAFTANWQYGIDVRRYAYVRFGTLLDESAKATSNGCNFIINVESYRPLYLFGTATDWNTYDRQLYVYSSSIFNEGNTANRYIGRMIFGNHRFWHVLTSEMSININPASNSIIDLYEVTFSDGTAIAIYASNGLTLSNIYATDMQDTLWTQTTASFTARNFISRRTTRALFRADTSWSGNAYLIDFDVDSWTISFLDSGVTGEVYRQYTFKINVTDTDGIPIENANVTLFDMDNVQEFSVLTGVNGSFSERTVNYGFYNYTGGNTPYMKTPHNLTITHPSYDTLSYQVTIDEWKTVVQVVLTSEKDEYFMVGLGGGAILGGLLFLVLGILITKKRV